MTQIFKGIVDKDILNGVGLTLFMFVVAAYLPVVGFFCALFIPLPMLFYRVKLGRQRAILIPAIVLGIMLIILGGFSIDWLFFSELLFLGFCLGELYEMDTSVEKTVGYAAAIVLGSGVAALFIYGHLAHDGFMGLVSDYVAQNLRHSVTLYRGMGMSEENIHLISNSLPAIQYVLIRILPALAVMIILFVGWTSILFSRPFFMRKGLFYPDFGRLTHWKAPEHLVWAVIGCGVLLLIPERGLKIFGLNGLLIMMTIFFFEGIAIVAFYFEKKRFPSFIRFFLYSLIALQQIILLLIIGLGFFDVWLNFRKLKTDRGEPSPSDQ